jgi:hypothetical protein
LDWLNPARRHSTIVPSDADAASRSTLAGAPVTDANHLFANNVRFLSMFAIIAVHTLGAYPGVFRLTTAPAPLQCLAQPFKFGTIAFFLVAGFLFGERIDRCSPLQYYARRLQNVFLPWSVWYLAFCALRVSADVVHGRIWIHSPRAFAQVGADLSQALLGTSYWFVPNLLIALAVLLVFRRFLNDVRMGLAFFAVSLFYAINIYGHWFPVQHSRAVFGFVFYLWLGAWGAWHFAALEKWLSCIPAGVLIGAMLLTNLLAFAEARMLFALHSADPMNSLRITNQLYSVVVVLAIVRVRRAVWPRFVDVRAHTFGLYLTHTVGLAVLAAILVRVPSRLVPIHSWNSLPGLLLLLPVMFVVTYGACLLLVRALLSRRWLCWAVGPRGRSNTTGRKIVRHSARRETPAFAAPVSKDFGSLARRS